MMLAATATTVPTAAPHDFNPTWITALVALAALVVSARQWWTARQNLRLAMFDRRWTLYNNTLTLLEVAAISYPSQDHIDGMNAGLKTLQQAKFIVPKKAQEAVQAADLVISRHAKRSQEWRNTRDTELREQPAALAAYNSQSMDINNAIGSARLFMEREFTPLLNFSRI